MRSNEDYKSSLRRNLFRSFVRQSFFWTLVIIITTVASLFGLQWIADYRIPALQGFLSTGTFFLLMFFALLLWILIMVFLIQRLLKKVISYVDELQKATDLLFDKSVKYIRLSPELGSIAVKINQLKQESQRNEFLAKENEKRKNDLIMYLAHDLKTPLASVIGYLTLLHDEGQISPELRQKFIAIALDKSERLEDLINEFFEIARFNLSGISLKYSHINLTLLLEQLIYEFGPIFKEKGLRCRLSVSGDILLHCDSDKIQRVFDNLLRNAVFYSFRDSTVDIQVKEEKDRLMLRFINQGHPIAKEKLEQIFEQFYRLDTSRSSEAGAGLGLAIAKEIVELHKGSIVAQSEGNQICFLVTLPKS